MSKTIFLFSGQGSQYKGMGKEFLENNKDLENIYNIGKEICGFDIKDISFNADEDTLSKTNISQPIIFTMSISCFYTAINNDINLEGVAGHSLGEYAAMVASKMVSLEDGFKLIYYRSQAMQKVALEKPGSMYAIIGSNEETIEKVCKDTEGYVCPVNYNSPAQTVIAGETISCEKAIETFKEMGIKTVKLPVNAAFHSKLMENAAEEFKSKISDIKFNKPIVPFYSNLLGDELKNYDDMYSYLANHIISPVKFTKELESIKRDGYTNFIEIGPNKIITSLVKKTLKNVKSSNIENFKTLEKTKSLLEK